MKAKIKYWTQQKDQEEIKKKLLHNAVALTTTDTVCGLLASITESGFFNLNEIKGARENKPYLVLVGAPEKLNVFVQIEKLNTAMLNVIAHCWPGPLTIIFRAHQSLPFYLKSSQGTIAIRCPRHDGLLNLLAHFDGLFSTSANKSGCPIPQHINDLAKPLIKKIAHIVVDEPGGGGGLQPSTIIDFSLAMDNSIHPVRVLRNGAYAIKDIEKHYGASFEEKI